jgi:mono/diheme cytochrome c family protein
LNPKPANYAQRSSTEEKQIRVVTNGGAAEKLSPVMPSWDEVLSKKQIRDVVTYIRTNLSGPKAVAVADVAPPATTADSTAIPAAETPTK